jgi:DinB superfamily
MRAMTGAEGPRDPRQPPPLEPALEELRLRLAGDLEAVLAAVAPLDQPQADWKPAPARWSVGEVLHHLVLSNQAFGRAVRLLVQRGRHQGLTAVSGTRRSWPRLRAAADARVSGPVANPEPVTPTHRLPIDALRRDLAASHAAVTDQIPELAGLDLALLRLPHPLGFDLNLYQWADIAGAHERRHLAQILAVTADPRFPPCA